MISGRKILLHCVHGGKTHPLGGGAIETTPTSPGRLQLQVERSAGMF